MSDDPVHLIEWGSDGTWYDIEQFRQTVGDDCSYDFAFIDDPNRPYGPSRGIRDDKGGA
jgi:hypothetical protein